MGPGGEPKRRPRPLGPTPRRVATATYRPRYGDFIIEPTSSPADWIIQYSDDANQVGGAYDGGSPSWQAKRDQEVLAKKRDFTLCLIDYVEREHKDLAKLPQDKSLATTDSPTREELLEHQEAKESKKFKAKRNIGVFRNKDSRRNTKRDGPGRFAKPRLPECQLYQGLQATE